MANIYVWTSGNNTDPDGGWATAINSAAEFEKYLEGTHAVNNIAAGDVVYIRSSLTLNDNWDSSGTAGTGADPITFIGVASGTTAEPPAYTDWADGNLAGGADGRPVFTCAAYGFKTGSYYKLYNLSFTTTHADGVLAGAYNVYYNCKAVNNSSTNDRSGFEGTSYCTYISCEACGEVGVQVVCRAFVPGGSRYLFCYAHDCRSGYYCDAASNQASFCIAEDCSVYGIYVGARAANLIMNCSFNDCPQAIYGSTAAGNIVINNAIKSASSDGIIWTTANTNSNFFFKNAGHEDAGDVVDMWDGVGAYPHADPEWLDADVEFTADGNLSLASTSDCIDNGLALTLGVG